MTRAEMIQRIEAHLTPGFAAMVEAERVNPNVTFTPEVLGLLEVLEALKAEEVDHD